MSDNRKRILEMVAEKKISVDEAAKLLAVTEEPSYSSESAGSAETGSKNSPKYLRVTIRPCPGSENVDRVNVRIPLSLVRAGVKLTSLIPNEAADKVDSALKEKGVGFNLKNLKEEDLELLIDALSDLEVDIEGGTGKVNVFTE